MKRPVTSAALRVQAQRVGHLHALALQAWCRASSEDPAHWTPALPEYAQCGATALVVQDVLGGDLMTGRLLRNGRLVTHCWNLLEGDVQVDLTARQLAGARFLGTSRVVRDAVLAHEPTAYRYAYLAARFAAIDHARRRR